jgi:hypothetical protein
MSENPYKVAYSLVEGTHFFKSADERVTGLCVAAADPTIAYNEVAAQLTYLLGMEIKPVMATEDFLQWLETYQDKPKDKTFTPIPAAQGEWETAEVREAA